MIQKKEIDTLISSKIENKLKNYGRETTSMPFLARMIQDSEKIAAYSFIHSISTSLGMSIYEEVSEIIAQPNCDECCKKYALNSMISEDQKKVIGKIIRELRNNKRTPNIQNEIQIVLKADCENTKSQKSGKIADFYMKKKNEEFYFEIKTAKPNIDVFKESKTKLLEWVARRGKKINPYLVFPYNPYHPNPYERFTRSHFVTLNKDLLVGKKYWNFLGGKNSFQQLLDIFDAVGKRYKNKLIKKFKEVAKENISSY